MARLAFHSRTRWPEARYFRPSFIYTRELSRTTSAALVGRLQQCPHCQGRVRLLALRTEDGEVKRYLRAIGEPTELPIQESARLLLYWCLKALRRQEPGDEAA